jgi:YidC/Oxa1 family membrane protein insertase
MSPSAAVYLLIAIVLAWPAAPARAQAVRILGEQQAVFINLAGGLPARWETCAGPCADGDVPRRLLLRAGEGGNRLEWFVPGDEDATAALGDLRYTHEVRQGDGTTTVIVSSIAPWDGIQLIHRYRLRHDGHVLEASLQMPGGARLRLAGGADLKPAQLPGLGAMYSRATAVAVTADGAVPVTAGSGAEADTMTLAAGDWAGLRGRFWTVLLSAGDPIGIAATAVAPDRPVVVAGREARTAGPVEFRLYAGPVERTALAAADPVLTGMLYASLWQPLRWLSFGLQAILEFWHARIGSWAIAILLLSVSVKVLMWPLTFIAGHWQDQVNRTQSLLAPELAAIKREHSGEEAHRRTLAVYAKHGVSPWYTLKSLAGFLVQVPVFIAAFDMLGEQFGLAGARFLWVDDLSLPDHLLPFAAPAPFFGTHFNLLPFAMTGLTLLASRLQEDPGLAPELRQGQRRRLYAMAAAFFVLLYTFPASMVLYWTTNNALHLGVVLAGRLKSARRGPAPAAAA